MIIAQSQESIVLNMLLKRLEVSYEVQSLENILKVAIDIDKLLAVLGNVAKEYNTLYTGYTGDKSVPPMAIDRIDIHIGDYNITAREEYVTETSVVSKGWSVKKYYS